MPFTPIERKAAFMAAVTLKEAKKSIVAREVFGVTWTHLDAVLLGSRDGSSELKGKIADYVGIPSAQFWREPAEARTA